MSTAADKKGAVQAGVPREFYTVKEFAAACCLNTNTVYRMCDRGEIAAIRPGGKEWRIPRSEIDRLTHEAYQQAGEKQSA